MMAVNIKDIARLSGVGISTVSRVMNNSGSVSEATRKKVMDVINSYNYIPNNSARNLKVAQSKNIALLVKGITNPFFNKMIRVIEQGVALRGYPLMIQNVDQTADELAIAIQEKQDRNLCGVIIMGGSYNYSEERIRQLSIPCVLLTISAGENVDPSLYSSVTIDDEKEGYIATSYLISQGHRRIGFLYHTPSAEQTPNALRYNGYVRALKEHGIPFDPNLVATSLAVDESGYKVGFQLMKQLYIKNRDMTAVFAFADILAIGAAKAVFSMGLSVPDDISIIGFDGIEMAEYYHPSLDTIYQPDTKIALSGIEILFDMMQGGKAQHIVYDSMLLKRGSTKRIISRPTP
jgi:DNA-binding LacI/PurR family transcriptional regulator